METCLGLPTGVDALSPANQQKVTEKIQQMIQQQAENGGGDTPKGMMTDKLA